MDVLDNLGEYFSQFDRPIDVHAIATATKWANLQSLGHDANLKDLKKNFHGLADQKLQQLKYSMSNPTVLSSPWKSIMNLVMGNAEIGKLMTTVSGLGDVGRKVLQFPSMGAVFAKKPAELLGEGS